MPMLLEVNTIGYDVSDKTRHTSQSAIDSRSHNASSQALGNTIIENRLSNLSLGQKNIMRPYSGSLNSDESD